MNMKFGILNRIILILLILPRLMVGVVAGPVIIRDNRVRDRSLTPALGRGYSLGTNSYQSVCFGGLKTTPASFDFEYSFEDLNDDDVKTEKMEGTFKGADAYHFLRKHVKRKSFIRNRKRYYNHHLIATLTVDSYYSSINESLVKLSKSAEYLLTSGDILGFFSSCGTYYMRSISRRSKFITIFKYTSQSKKRNEDFEQNLEQTIRRFSLFKHKKYKNSKKAKKAKKEEAFASQLSRMNLQIITKSMALEKRDNVNLIAFDLASYKETIANAFKSTQDEFTGRIVSMEVVPWVENTIFQARVKVQEKKNPQGRKLPRFEQKFIMNENAEFYIRINRLIRSIDSTLEKAVSCRNNIASTFKQNGAFLREYEDSLLVNHRTGELMPLRELDMHISENNMKDLEDHRSFLLHGSAPEFKDGASYCLGQILETGLSVQPYRYIPACRNLVKYISFRPHDVIDDYCMPILAEKNQNLNN